LVFRSKALIVPHAGYAYSGAVAAAAFARLGEKAAQAIRRVVVIGPSHHAAFRGIAAPTAEAFATPLGRVPVDREALSALAGLRFVGLADEPHAPEHALEVELPFLQLRLGAFAAVPLLVGGSARRCRRRSTRAGVSGGSCRSLREMPLRLGDEVPVGRVGDQTRRGKLLEGGHHLRRGGPHVGFEPAPQPLPERILRRLRQPLEPPLGVQEVVLRGLERQQRPP
jgi:Memo-like protein